MQVRKETTAAGDRLRVDPDRILRRWRVLETAGGDGVVQIFREGSCAATSASPGASGTRSGPLVRLRRVVRSGRLPGSSRLLARRPVPETAGGDGVAQALEKTLRSRLALLDRRETVLDRSDVGTHLRAKIRVAADHESAECDTDGRDRSDDAQQLERLHASLSATHPRLEVHHSFRARYDTRDRGYCTPAVRVDGELRRESRERCAR